MDRAANTILVTAATPARADLIREGLRAAGFTAVAVLPDRTRLVRRIVDDDPDVVVIDLGDPPPEALDEVIAVAGSVRKPIAVFVDRSDAAATARAVEAGIASYVVDGLEMGRLRQIVEITVWRFAAFAQLADERDALRRQLADRKAVERAKGLLAERHGLSENEAYTLLRKRAMDEHRSMGEVARGVIGAAGRPVDARAKAR